MTDAELQAIRDRCAKASPGAWGGSVEGVTDDTGRTLFYNCYAFRDDDDPQVLADAIFVSFARQDIPALLAEVDRLRTLLGDLDAKSLKRIANSLPPGGLQRYSPVEEILIQRQMVEVEREACAQVADTFRYPEKDVGCLDGRGDEAEAIAAAIRARGTPLTPLP